MLTLPAPNTSVAPIEHDLAVQIAGLVAATKEAPLDGVTGQTKFTPEVITRICAALRTGHTVVDACLYAGVSIGTYENWMRQGRKGEQPFKCFVEVMERLNVAAYTHAVECFSKGAKDDPKVAERFLARRAKKQWGTGEDDGNTNNITVQIGTFALEGGPTVD